MNRKKVDRSEQKGAVMSAPQTHETVSVKLHLRDGRTVRPPVS